MRNGRGGKSGRRTSLPRPTRAARDEHGAHEEGAASTEPPARPVPAGAAPTNTPGHDQHTAHDKHAGHSVTMFRNKFWIPLLLTLPTLIWTDMVQQWLRYRAPSFPGFVLSSGNLRDRGLLLRRLGVPAGCHARAARATARHDDTHRARHHRCVRVQHSGNRRLSGHDTLVGAGYAGDHHANSVTGSRCARSHRRAER